ncbi:MAG: beta-propeller fold lactonase family protein [Gammaproteobacteria bacterium]|nr:beta-propeller fold lactonase family protein [Gammaproteobacteria bacterium]
MQASLILVPSGTHSLGYYVRDPWTGALVDRGYVPTGQGPDAVAVSNDRYVYVANSKDGTVSAYAWESQTDRLTSLGTAIASGPQPASLAVVGSDLYALNTGNDTITAFGIGANGTLTVIGSITPSATLTGLVAGPGVLYGLAADGITTFSAGNGMPSGPSTTPLNGIVAGATDSAGNLYVLTSTDVVAFTAGAGGTLNAQDTVPLPSGLTASALSVGASQLNVVGQGSGDTELVTFPLVGGGVSCPTSAVLGSTGQTTGTLISPLGHTVYVTNTSRDELVAYSATTTGSGPTLIASARTRPLPQGVAGLVATVGIAPQRLYVVEQAPNMIAGYAVAANGALSGPVTSQDGGNGPSAGTIAPDGATFYASDWSSGGAGTVTVLPVDSQGQLGLGSSVAAGQSPMGIAVDPSGRYLYVANSCYQNTSGGNCPGTISSYSLSGATPTALGASPTDTSGLYPMLLTVDPTGQYLYVAQYASGSVEGFAIDQDTGALTSTNTIPAGSNPWTVISGPAGRHLYVTNNHAGSPTSISIYRIDAANGSLTPATTPTLTVPGEKALGLAIGPKGRRLYVATQQGTSGGANGTVDVFTRTNPLASGVGWDTTPVALTSATPFTDAYGLAIAHNGKALYVVDNVLATASGSVPPGNIQTLSIPPFSEARNPGAYASLGVTTTGNDPVQAIPGGGLG